MVAASSEIPAAPEPIVSCTVFRELPLLYSREVRIEVRLMGEEERGVSGLEGMEEEVFR